MRFVITKVDKAGLRVLAVGNQGRNHHDTRKSAEMALKAMLSNNSEDTLKSVFGDLSKMKVLEVECYDHGDAIGTVYGFDGER